MEEADSLFPKKVGFLPFFQPKNMNEIGYLFVRDNFAYPVFMDFSNVINKLNQFPKASQYHCFLLDKDNKVLMIGNPALNPKIWELYKEQIGGGKQTEQSVLTTVTVDKMGHEYGTVKKGSSNPAVFTITNTGDQPLVIYHVSASCGCTNVEWEKRPVEPGQTAIISVEMTPDETGYFSKTLDIHCNIKESPLKLTINGIVNE